MITIHVPSIPVAQPRQRTRVATIHGRPMAMNYTPSKSPIADFKATVKMAAMQAYSAAPLEGPLRVSLTFVFPRVKPGWLKKVSPWFASWKAGARIPHVTKPDRDNLDKAVLDALKGLVFNDDKQACGGELCKWIAADGEQAHVEITIEPLPAS